VFALPLLVLYEGLAASYSGDVGALSVRNAADVILKLPFMLFSGARGTMYFFATVIAVSVYLVGRDLRKTRDRPRLATFALMLGESAILAALLGVVISTVTAQLLGALATLSAQQGPGASAGLDAMPPGTKLMLALGAGLYEELLFRVLLVGGMAAGLRWLIGGRAIPGTIAAAVGAVIFSAFHYIGPYGDQFQIASFTYRALAGLAFSALYLLRGFGITAWTHALYDVGVMLL
jgi:Type II CAAX prenyl endopeptidase Rce1-like